MMICNNCQSEVRSLVYVNGVEICDDCADEMASKEAEEAEDIEVPEVYSEETV